MSDRTFRLILDGKKGGLVKGTTPASAAKKVGFYTNSVKTGKSSIKFELQETTKGSKKKVYGPYKTKVKMAGGELTNTQKLLQYQKQLQEITDELHRILKIQKEYIGKSDNNINKEIKKLTKNVSFNQQESNRILSNIQEKKPKTNSVKLLNLVMARKIILNKIESLEQKLWNVPVENYLQKKPVISNNSLERQLQKLYNLQKKHINEFGPNNTQYNAKIANLEEQIRRRDLNKEGRENYALSSQISRLGNIVLQPPQNISTRHEGFEERLNVFNRTRRHPQIYPPVISMVPLNSTSKINSEIQHGLPTALSVHQVNKSKKAEQRTSEKEQSQARKKAQNAKSSPFNNR
jgi:hypothetical protein